MKVYSRMKFEDVDQLWEIIHNLDRAEERQVLIQTPEGVKAVRSYKAIWNIDSNSLEAITSDRYSLLQHYEAFEPVVKSLKMSKVVAKGEVINGGGRVWINILFDEVIRPADKEEIAIGIRVMNSYDRTASLQAAPYGLRLVCQNGMFLRSVLGIRTAQLHVGTLHPERLFINLIEKTIKAKVRLSELTEIAMREILKEEMLEKILTEEIHFGKRRTELILEKVKKIDNPTKWDLYNIITQHLTHEAQNISENRREYFGSLATQVLLAKNGVR
ncbi:MAG: DUF932 domain-containing protein [Candidatus Heimdallarchaeaceae archaeon]